MQAELSDNLKLIAKLYGDRDNRIKGNPHRANVSI